MLKSGVPALVLAPMDGITDAPMRALQGSTGAFSYAVSEFIRVSSSVVPIKVFRREVPELCAGGQTATGLPVQVQILGGDPVRMAKSAYNAWRAGATAIDINFGCPAPTVNRNDGGASLLKSPCRIRDVVRAVRESVPAAVPVSAKLRLGWDSIESIHENASMAAEGGAAWLTIHARTRTQGYAPPVYWEPIGQVRRNLPIPIVANGDIWTFDDFLRCRDVTGCIHFMIGRSALANPRLPYQIAKELGVRLVGEPTSDWGSLFREFVGYMEDDSPTGERRSLTRLKQWSKFAHHFGEFRLFHQVKLATTLAEFFEVLETTASLATD